jgi:hypothetical protein
MQIGREGTKAAHWLRCAICPYGSHVHSRSDVARDAKHVPGRKTDVSDAQWLQRLHSYGLLRASFRPKGLIAELRAYVRQREICSSMRRHISSTCRRRSSIAPAALRVNGAAVRRACGKPMARSSRLSVFRRL